MKVVQSFDLTHAKFSIARDGGKYKLELGDWTSEGWHWDGKGDELGGFFVRVANSKAASDFVKMASDKGVSFGLVKQDILNSVNQHDSGVYELTGDNVQWHFGEDLIDRESEIDGIVESSGLPKDKVEDAVYDVDLSDYDAFKKSSYFKDAKDELVKRIESSNSFQGLIGALGDSGLKRDMLENVMEWQSEKLNTEVGKKLGAVHG
jgi:hypothetical protein